MPFEKPFAPAPGFPFRGRLPAFRLLALLLVLISSRNRVWADDYQTEIWTAEKGLPDSTVTSIAQTPDGYLWVGTFNGLVRFDGLNFETFDPENTPALAHARLRGLNLDKRGTLWINTFDGSLTTLRAGRFEREWTCKVPNDRDNTLVVSSSNSVAFVLDHGYEFYKSLDAPPGTGWKQLVFPHNTLSILPYGNGECVTWFNGLGMRLWRLFTDHFQSVPEVSLIPGQGIRCVAPDAAGRFWIGTDQQLALLDGTNVSNVTPTNGEPVLNVRLIHLGEDGGAWVVANNRVRKLTGRRWVVEATAMQGVLALNEKAYGILDDHRGGIWLFDYGRGLFHVDNCGSVWRFHAGEGFNNERVATLLEDREGSLWAGFELGGLVRIRASRFQHLDPGDTALGVIRSVSQDAAGTIWVGSQGGGLGRWQNSVYTNLLLPGNALYGSAVSVCPDPAGRLWISGGNEDLYVYEHGALTPIRPLIHSVKAILADRAGRVWVGTRDALYAWDGREPVQFKLQDGLSPGGVRALAEDSSGTLWCGGGDGVLYRLTGRDLQAFRPPDHSQAYAIWSLLVESGGTVWAGTFHGGLLRFEDQKFTRFNKAQGLPDNIISQILSDPAGNLWLGTHQGIFRVGKSQLNAVADGRQAKLDGMVFGRADGLPSLECSGGYQPAAWRTTDGRLCFCTVKGVVSVRPEEVTPNSLPPKIAIERVIVEGAEQWSNLPKSPGAALGSMVQELSGPSPNGPVASLKIPPGRGQLEIRYAGLSLISPERIQYRYQLQGVDPDWVEAGSRRFAHYDALPSGNYHFRVLAGNSDGVWAATPATLHIVILPYFYEAWWFRGLIAGTALALVFGFARYRFNLKLRRKTAEMRRQHALEQERARIAKDLHDDLGSSLTLIAVMGDLAHQDKDGGRVGKMSDIARQAIKSLDEIVWAVNPRNDSLAQLIDYVSGYVVEYLSTARIRCRLDVPDQLPPHTLSSNIRYNILLVIKEALQNIVKHARANEVRQCVTVSPRQLRIVLSDNGCGFASAPDDALADGLRNMRQRMADIGGSFRLDSRPGIGTEIILELPFPTP